MHSALRAIGARVRERRRELGLTQARLARLAGLSRVTINQLESGALGELGFTKLEVVTDLLGLRLEAGAGAREHSGLVAAGRTASVCYRTTMDPHTPASALVSGDLPAEWLPHLSTLIDEAPMSIIVAAVAEAAAEAGVQPRRIWQNLERWAVELGSPRRAWA